MLRRTKSKGTLAFLQELSVTLQEEWQHILRVGIRHIILECPTGDLRGFLHVEVAPDIDLDSISFLCFR